MSMPIVNRSATVEEIRTMLRESPLGALRQMLPDAAILDACRACGHTFRRRLYDPVVTVLHYLAQAIQREQSFAATWQELWAPLAADFPEVASAAPDDSALTHARARLPVAVLVAAATSPPRRCATSKRTRTAGRACGSWPSTAPPFPCRASRPSSSTTAPTAPGPPPSGILWRGSAPSWPSAPR